MKKCLVTRIGAIGDEIIITPVLKKLKKLGYYVIVHTGHRGKSVLLHSPFVDEFIDHKEDVKIEDFNKYTDGVKDKVKPDKFINFTESIEVNVALHPIGPTYIYPKNERYAKCNRNYYEISNAWAKIGECQKLPILHFTEEEEKKAKGYIPKGKFTILWQLSGSGGQKAYPWADYVIGEVLKNHKDIHFITTGDERCQLLESIRDKDITNLSGKIDIRIAMCLTKFVNLVISPDTGVLHASGCYLTPKIGLLGHTTIENITKHFLNDYSLEAECPCSPCFHLIYDHKVQCPVEPITGAAWCMSEGLKPERVYDRIKEILKKYGK